MKPELPELPERDLALRAVQAAARNKQAMIEITRKSHARYEWAVAQAMALGNTPEQIIEAVRLAYPGQPIDIPTIQAYVVRNEVPR